MQFHSNPFKFVDSKTFIWYVLSLISYLWLSFQWLKSYAPWSTIFIDFASVRLFYTASAVDDAFIADKMYLLFATLSCIECIPGVILQSLWTTVSLSIIISTLLSPTYLIRPHIQNNSGKLDLNARCSRYLVHCFLRYCSTTLVLPLTKGNLSPEYFHQLLSNLSFCSKL